MTSCQFSSVIGCNATANPQQVVAKLHYFDLLWTCWRLSICCTTSRHVEMLWICCRRQICCGLVVQLVVQQIHNKSNKWSLTFTARSELRKVLFLALSVYGFFVRVWNILGTAEWICALNSHGRRVWSLARHFSVLSAACMQFMFGKTSLASSVIVYLCMCAFVVLVFSTMPRDWLGRMSPTWPILCGMGRKRLTYILAIGWCVCESLWHIIGSGRYVCITSWFEWWKHRILWVFFAHFSRSVVGDRKFVDYHWWARTRDLNIRWLWTCLGNCRVCLPLCVFHTYVHINICELIMHTRQTNRCPFNGLFSRITWVSWHQNS